MTRPTHPSDAQLAVGDDDVLRHLRVCERCTARLASTDEVPVPDVEDGLPEHAVAPELLDRLSGLPDFDVPSEPGQVWRIEWDGVAAPVVVVRVDESVLLVWALGEDADMADAGTGVIHSGEPLGVPFGVWTTLEFAVPRVTLDRLLGELPAGDFKRLVDVAADIRVGGAARGDGAAFSSDLDPRLAYRDGLADPLHTLAAVTDLLSMPEPDRPSLRQDVLRDLGPSQLQALDFSPAEIDALRDDRLVLQPPEIDRLALASETRAEYVVERAPETPIGLLRRLHEPRRRRQVAEKATEHGLSEADERRRAARRVYAGHMRTTSPGEPDWDDAIDRYFATR